MTRSSERKCPFRENWTMSGRSQHHRLSRSSHTRKKESRSRRCRRGGVAVLVVVGHSAPRFAGLASSRGGSSRTQEVSTVVRRWLLVTGGCCVIAGSLPLRGCRWPRRSLAVTLRSHGGRGAEIILVVRRCRGGCVGRFRGEASLILAPSFKNDSGISTTGPSSTIATKVKVYMQILHTLLRR